MAKNVRIEHDTMGGVVVILAPVDSVRVSPDSADVAVGGTRTYTAQLFDPNGNPLTGRAITWTTASCACATVDQSGVVTGVAPGVTKVRATSEGVFDEAVVRITPPAVDSVLVSPDSAVVQAGQTTTFTAQLFDPSGNPLTGRTNLPGGAALADAFHTYAVEWEPSAIRFYLDGNLYQTRTPADVPAGAAWVYNHPFFMLLNVAVGGNWPGSPDGSTSFPQQMLVDYVRVYQR